VQLVVAVVQDRDAHGLLKSLSNRGFGATRLASTGGFLREGNTTVMIGVEDARTDQVLSIIQETCHPRQQVLATMSMMPQGEMPYPVMPVEVTVGGATVFVLHVDRMVRTAERS